MGLGRLNIKHLIMLRKTKLYRHLFLAHNSLLRDVFSVFLLHNSDNDPMLKTVFVLHQLLLTMFGHCFKAMLICSVLCLSVCLFVALATGVITCSLHHARYTAANACDHRRTVSSELRFYVQTRYKIGNSGNSETYYGTSQSVYWLSAEETKRKKTKANQA